MLLLVLQTLPAVVVLSVVVWRFSMLRRDPSSRALWVTLTFLGVGLVFYCPPVYRSFDSMTGSLTAAAVAELLCTLGSAAGVRTVCRTLSGSRQIWSVRDWVISGLAGVAVLSLLSSFPVRRLSPLLAHSTYFFDGTWRSVVYNIPFLVTLTSALTSSGWVWWRYGRAASRSAVRTGLGLVAAGSVAGLVFVAVRTGVLVCWQLHDESTWWVKANFAGESVSLLVCGVLLAAGTSWEALSGRGVSVREWVWASVALHDLQPLWQVLVARYPATSLPGVGSGGRGRLRLLRMVIEIRDGLLALSEDVDHAFTAAVTREAEAGRTGSDTAAVVTAVLLHATMKLPVQQSVTRAELPSGGGKDLFTEVEWLRQVAKEYRSRSGRCQALADRIEARAVAA